MKRKQINFTVDEEENSVIRNTMIGLMIRDGKTYTRKDVLLTLCYEFLSSKFPDKINQPMEKHEEIPAI